MARKPTKVEADSDPKRDKAKTLLEEVRENFKRAEEADRHNRESYRDALKFCFVPGEQWEDSVKRARGPKRITREFNETRVKVKSVINHIRANRPTAKIRPVEEGDVDTAEAINGLWLNIWNTSDADNITDFAAETQVAAGMGAWMVRTEYADDSAFDQNIVIKPIRNPLQLYPDHACKEQDKSDARHWIYHTKLSKTEYEAKYKDAEKTSFEPSEFSDETDPNDDDESVWVAEYWRKEPIVRQMCLLSTGETVDKAELQQLPEGVTILRERAVKTHKIVQYVCSATEILEGPNEWAGKEFPFIVVYGEYVIVDGKTYWSGITQVMMDAQRSHNETLSGVYETIALSPQAKYWATAEQAKGLMGQWNQAVEENLQVMLYNPDNKAPGPPVRVGGADVPAALMQASQMSRDSMKSVSGIFDASLGEVSNETSGRAIRARQDQGLVVTYNYGDNMAKAIGRTCKIVLDLIPKIIDTPRTLRILGKDGAEKYVKINQFDPVSGEVVNDLSRGKYDFVVTQGPNFATQRQEAAEVYTQLSQSDPTLMAVAGDLIVKQFDYPMADEIAERKRMMLPPQILQAINGDKQQDPAVAAAMAQVAQLQAQVQEQAAMVEQAAQEAQQEKAGAEKAKADVQIAVANLNTKKAEIDAQMAQFQALVAETQAKMAMEASQKGAEEGKAEVELDRAQLAEQVSQALVSIQEQAAGLISQYAEALAQMQAQTLQAVQNQTAPKQKTVRLVRKNGGLAGEIIETGPDGQSTTTTVQMTRENGQLVGQATPTVQ